MPEDRFLYNCEFSENFDLRERDNSSINTSNEGVSWIHLDLNNEFAMTWLNSSSGLPQAAIDGLCVEETRPRANAYGQGLLIYLRALNLNPGKLAEDMVSIRIWMEPSKIVSSQRQNVLSVTDLYKDLQAGRGPSTASSFVTSLVEHIADRIGDFVTNIEETLENEESNLESANPTEFRATLGSIRRQIAGVRRFLAPQRDALDRLQNIKIDFFNDSDRQRFREETDRISRYLEDLELARERAVVLHEAFVSQLAQEQSAKMYVLAIITAIFLPLTFITGLFGMNVGGLPGVESSFGFATVLLSIFILFIALILYFKTRKWF